MDTALIIPAFVMGLAGSLHCVGMCGPIAMALPLQGRSSREKLTGGLLYNAGRITTYTSFGLLAGWMGSGLKWFGWQQRISLILGITILLFMIVPAIMPVHRLQSAIQARMSGIRQTLARVLFRGTPTAMFATGMLNGLLPCGLVYMALAGSAISGDPLQGGSLLHRQMRQKLQKMYPALLIIMAILLIIRGLDLGIPFISPSLRITDAQAVHCK